MRAETCAPATTRSSMRAGFRSTRCRSCRARSASPGTSSMQRSQGSGAASRIDGPARIDRCSLFRRPSKVAPTRSMIARKTLCVPAALLSMLLPAALAQQAPPPPPAAATVAPQRTPGLSPELAEASRLIREGQHAAALAKIDAVLATDAKNPQARFLKGVMQADEAKTDAAIA